MALGVGLTGLFTNSGLKMFKDGVTIGESLIVYSSLIGLIAALSCIWFITIPRIERLK